MKKNSNMSSFLGLLIVLVLTIGALIVFASQMGGNGDTSSPNTASSSNSDSNVNASNSDVPDTSDIENNSIEPPVEGSNDTSEESKEIVYTYQYKIDIDKYLQYIEPENRDEYLFLVNTTHTLSSDYKPDDLIDVINTRNGWPTQKLRLYAAKALEALFAEAEAEGMLYVNKSSGYRLGVTSAYRSYASQETNFANKVQRVKNENPGISQADAEAKAAIAVARPGTSEHQTGLCLDMHNMPEAEQAFKNEDAAKWLAENSYKFGFILRYPEEDFDLTGIMYEPWHFRYVGRYHATRMYELGMCFEEYMEYLENN